MSVLLFGKNIRIKINVLLKSCQISFTKNICWCFLVGFEIHIHKYSVEITNYKTLSERFIVPLGMYLKMLQSLNLGWVFFLFIFT